MAAAKTRPPHADALGVDHLLRLQERDGVANIINLFQWEEAPLLPLTAAKAAIVKREGHIPCVSKDFGVLRQDQFPQSRKPMTENNARPFLAALEIRWEKQVSFQAAAFAVE